ncbi:vault inter-alpha-trypsin domain protein [Collimonas fungivorans]|uniref:Vault inter-alpha-trypsin domain protein n=1 Tax=Collimonas fungivorans TaxID=158899 RepID=A0A127PDQ8_9BURK|nr:VIT domain-containing protein [Collimonas fungivorans]AMO95887.1 vault inter-alpha-trypsin domain protein [Collimonas fungivorans]
MLRGLLAALCALLFLLPMAQARTVVPPRLIVANGAEQPIVLQSLQVSGEISGGMAQTTVQMVFFNPNRRLLEGQLQFPLLEGQQIVGFSLDVEGRQRPAVPVEKAKGRQIFEAIERRRVDPGLLEATQGNNFKLRIYPIPANGTRTVEIKYVEPLARQGKNWQYRLPLAYGDRMRDFDLTLNVHGAMAAPQASGSLGAIGLVRTGEQYQMHVNKSGFAASGMLNLLIPASEKPQTYTQLRDDGMWFVTEIPVAETHTARSLPKVIGLLWDSSGSGAGRDHDAEFAVLDRYFKAAGNAEVRLTRLRDRPEPEQSFHIANGNWSALRQALQNTAYDGASALGDWKQEADVGEYLLVSDGLSNYGNAVFPKLAAGQRLYALNSALAADASLLSAWAENTGGRLVQVSAQSVAAATQALLSESAHVETLTAAGAGDLQIESHDAKNGILRVAGRLRNPEAQLTLTTRQNGRLTTTLIPLSATAPAHPLAAYLWAGYRLRELEANRDLHRAEIRRIGQQFGLATRETSLIVLERLDDYVRYDVVPPQEYQAAFNQLKKLRDGDLRQTRSRHMENVLQQFQRKTAWWERDFSKDDMPKPKKVTPEAVRSDRRPGAGVPLQSASAPELAAPVAAAPMPPPAPAPVAGLQRAFEARENYSSKSVAGNGTATAAPQISVALQKWSANAPYIDRLKAATADTVYAIYLDEKPGYANSSAFFLDAADILLEKGQRDLALRVLSNLAEMDLENRAVLRILGYRLLQAGAPQLAIPVFEKVRQLAEEEPQSFRDLGLAYAADKQYQQAIDQLYEVVQRPWDARFPEIETIALAELNQIVATAGVALDTSRIDPRFLKNMPLDLRVAMTWDADNSDMDLWVTDPNGEKCFYGYPLTHQGGRMSRDFTQGYGPEEFSLRKAKPGKYKIETNYYGNSQQLIAGDTTLQVKLTTAFGTPRQKEQMVTLRLKDRQDTVFVGEFDVAP